jgi:threonine synthase
MLKYYSTRGEAPVLDFEEAVLAGLASDGGLYVPENLPVFSPAQLVAMQRMDYAMLAAEVLWPFFSGQSPVVSGQSGRQEVRKTGSQEILPNSRLQNPGSALFATKTALYSFLTECYRHFTHPATAPLKQLGSGEFVLELFHGPTLAFKDFALQFLGPLLDKLLTARGDSVTILGATSGDTGSAAIAGCRGREHMQIVILHPHERTSPMQRRQMTTVPDANVHNIAIQGSFDDCQNIVKALFSDVGFRQKQKLAAVNSINWARIMAQVVYYFYAALALGAPAKAVSFSVPTGNFGDVYAGYLAKRMGLPVDQLIVATNRNDILSRCINQGGYHIEGVTASLSPSMDIQISSNFERLLFDLYDRDAASVRELMRQLKEKKGFDLPERVLAKLRADFCAAKADDAETTATIADVYRLTGEILDPHTAVGVAAGRKCWSKQSPLVVLATASPAKFPEAVKTALGDVTMPKTTLDALANLQEKFTVLPNDAAAVKTFIESSIVKT